MNREKVWRWVVGCALAVLLVAGFWVGSSAAQKIRVAIGFNGPVKDMGWYESGYEGTQKLKEDPGVDEVTFHERINNADLERTLRRWAVEGYDLIFGHSFEFGEPTLKVASSFPKTLFAVPFFFKTEGHPNVVTYGAQDHEAVYLAGALAAWMSKSKKLGVIGGYPIPQQFAEHNSYRLGARSAVPEVKLVNVFINDWFDVSKAKEAALAMIDQGADVIFATASPMNFGGIKAAAEKGVYAIGLYLDVSQAAPNAILTSVMYVWHAPMKQIVLDMKQGKIKKSYLVGLRDGGARLAPFHPKVPPEVAQKVRTMEEDIRTGKTKVPYLAEKLID